MMYSEKVQFRIGDYNCRGRLSLRAILELLEDVGSRHAETVNDDIIASAESGIAWILTDWNTEIVRHPKADEKLLVNTWVIGRAPTGVVTREFEVLDKDHKPIIYAMARFALFDMSTQKLTRVTPEFLGKYFPEPALKHEFSRNILREKSEYENEYEILVRKTDIDFNGHVHNTIYMDYVEEIMRTAEVGGFRVVYRSPVIAGERLILKSICGDKENVGIYNYDGKVCTIIEITPAEE